MRRKTKPEDAPRPFELWLVEEAARVAARTDAGKRAVCACLIFETLDGGIETLTFPNLRAVQDGLISRAGKEHPQ